MSRISGRPAISNEHVYGLNLRVARWREGAAGTPLLFLKKFPELIDLTFDFFSARPRIARKIRHAISTNHLLHFHIKQTTHRVSPCCSGHVSAPMNRVTPGNLFALC